MFLWRYSTWNYEHIIESEEKIMSSLSLSLSCCDSYFHNHTKRWTSHILWHSICNHSWLSYVQKSNKTILHHDRYYWSSLSYWVYVMVSCLILFTQVIQSDITAMKSQLKLVHSKNVITVLEIVWLHSGITLSTISKWKSI